MNAKELFPTEQERNQVKEWLEILDGKVTKVEDSEGNILFESKLSFDNNKEYVIIHNK